MPYIDFIEKLLEWQNLIINNLIQEDNTIKIFAKLKVKEQYITFYITISSNIYPKLAK